MSGGGAWDDDDAPSPASIWDAADGGEDLADPLRLIDPDAAPTDRPRGSGLGDPAAWRAAEAGLARPLADAAAAFARLDERLRAWAPAHARAGVRRLALGQAAALMWAEGADVTLEHLALDDAGAAGRLGQEDHAMARAAWAARRLASARWSLASPAAVARFGERRPGGEDAPPPLPGWGAFARARGAAWIAAAEDWAQAVRALRDAHPLTQAAFAGTAWRRAGLSAAGAALGPGVVAMKIAARAGRGGAPFAPLARRRRPGGAHAADRLAGFCADAAEGAAEALALLERMQDWRARAAAAVADLSGRTPGLLVAALAASVALSAPRAARAAGVSASAAQRNLALLTDRGVAREITGQGRFRLWTAAL
jgi:hypothetical protein